MHKLYTNLVRTFFHLWSQPNERLSFKHSSSIAIPDHEPCITAGLYIYRIRRRERCAEAGTAAANAAVAPEADASKATDNLEFRKAAVNAADATEAATLKKPTGKLTDDTSEEKNRSRSIQEASW